MIRKDLKFSFSLIFKISILDFHIFEDSHLATISGRIEIRRIRVAEKKRMLFLFLNMISIFILNFYFKLILSKNKS